MLDKKDTYKIEYEFLNPRKNRWEELPKGSSFMIRDLAGVVVDKGPGAEILHIKNFSVEEKHRGKGIGTKALKDFCESYPEKLILVSAGVIEYEGETIDEEEAMKRLLRAVIFYEKVGFKSVNDYVGYEFHEAMVYDNEPGKKMLDIIKRILLEDRCNNLTWSPVEVQGKPALLVDGRIYPEDLPDGILRYDVRGSDYDPGRHCTIESGAVTVNHCGTIITKHPIKFYKGKDHLYSSRTLNFLGDEFSLEEYLWGSTN